MVWLVSWLPVSSLCMQGLSDFSSCIYSTYWVHGDHQKGKHPEQNGWHFAGPPLKYNFVDEKGR